MSITKQILIIGLSMLFVGCSTGRYPNYNTQAANGPESTSDLGARYLLGHGVEQSDSKAFYYFNEAAKDGDPFAQNELGYLYAAGKGTTQDYGKSLMYYQKAADHGLASAQYNLGLLYLHGLGTAPNRVLALKWFNASAAHGFEPAKQALLQYQSK